MAKKKQVIQTTPKQKRAVDNVLSGKFNSKAAALRDAGYSDESAQVSSRVLASEGIKQYLKSFSKSAMKRWNMTIEEKIVSVYMDGLDATKLYGKSAIEHPDHLARKSYADKLSEFFSWSQSPQLAKQQFQQFNFFTTPEKDREVFNDKLKGFLIKNI